MKCTRLRAFGFALILGLLAAVATPGSGAEERGNWKLAFHDEFERDLSGEDWKVLEGKWRIEGGWLSGQGQILCSRRFDGPQRLEYEARTAELSAVGDHAVGDLSAILAANESGYMGAYFFGFGSEGNRRSKLLVRGQEIADFEKTITPFKTHHVVCVWDGDRLMHVIDGEVVHRVKPEVDLEGSMHQMVGFYLWESGSIDNVRVYTRTGKAERPTKRLSRLTARTVARLVPNGSFEKLQPATRPPAAANWLLQKWSRLDKAQLVTDPSIAHRGRRCVRLVAAGEHGVRMHCVQDRGAMQLEPAKVYRIRVWARAAGAAPSMLVVEPGCGQFELTQTWQEYEVRYRHGADAKTEMGMMVAIRGGPAYVDDVSVVPDGENEPVSMRAAVDWGTLKDLLIDKAWVLPSHRERIPIAVRELRGQEAQSHCVSLPLVAVFRSLRFDFLLPQKIRVVEASAGGNKEVPFAIIAADRNPQVSGRDLFVFLANCPPHAKKTYHIYLKNREIEDKDLALTDQLPGGVNVVSTYPYDLDLEVLDAEPRVSVSSRMAHGRFEAELCGWAAQSAKAVLVSPDKSRRVQVPLEATNPGCWTVAMDFAFPEDANDGVWALEGTFTEMSGRREKVRSTFVVGDSLWAGTNAERIYEDDPPRFGADFAVIAAARNEWEAFQVAVASERGLQDVTLQASDLVLRGGKEKIEATGITIQCVEQVDIINALRSGPTPDPLVPWEKENVRPGKQRLAWVTVKVPPTVPAGRYAGKLIAASSNGNPMRLPVELEVFDFSLPDSRSFTPVFGAGVSRFTVGEVKRSQKDSYGESWGGYFRYLPNFELPYRRTVMDIARLFGERHITPFYYNQGNGPYPTPWSYDTQARTMAMDFTLMDEALEMFDDLDIKYLFPGSAYRIQLNRGGAIYFKNQAGKYKYGWHGTKLGRQMVTAWLKALHKHLRKKGWADRTIIYANDESWGKRTTDGREVNSLLTDYSCLIHEVAPGFGTFVADNAGGNWLEPLVHTDHFTGIMSKRNLERFQNHGGVHWGLYNRPTYLANPHGVARIIGLDSAFRRWSHYFFWDVVNWKQDPWVNPRYYIRAGTKNDFFMSGASRDGFATLVYPWPYWRSTWKPEYPTVCSSIRLEALRESAEDYEYIQMLREKTESLPAGSAQRWQCEALLEKVRTFVDNSNVRDDYKYGGSWGTFMIDSDSLMDLRQQVGRAIGDL